MNVLGIDGCKAGWFYLAINDENHAGFGIIKHIADLSQFQNLELALIDIPIGLHTEQTEQRQCDRLARTVLKPWRHASVFTPPCRSVLECDSYEVASKKNRECTGRGLSRQTWNIIPKIKEVDVFIRRHPGHPLIREMHPEVCFWALNQRQPMSFSKKTYDGYQERVTVLSQYFPEAQDLIERAMHQTKRSEVARDDIVDALVGALVASHADVLKSMPVSPEIDGMGLAMEIVYWSPG